MGLLKLPGCIMDIILEQCSCKDLAALCCTSKALNEIASTSRVWQPVCQSKWPQCNDSWYDGDWKALYGKRMQQPSSLPGLVDSAFKLTSDVKASAASHVQGTVSSQSQTNFMAFTHRVLALGLLYHAFPTASKHLEYQKLRECVRYWMEDQPQVALAAVKTIHDQLLTLNPAAHMEAACIRSALHFMMEGRLAHGHASFLGRLERELAQLDALLKKCQNVQEGPAMKRRAALPANLPASHWWWGPQA